MIMKVWLIVCCFRLVLGDYTDPAERTCYSRFDYDEKLLTKLVKLEDKIKKMEKVIKKRIHFEKALGDVVAFTLTAPAKVQTSDSLTFTTVITNEGASFDTSTGKFVCPVSGLYFFSLYLVTSFDNDSGKIECYVTKNGLNKVRAYIKPHVISETWSTSKVYSVSNAVHLKLEKGDVVTVANCVGISVRKPESWSSFSGHLVRPTTDA